MGGKKAKKYRKKIQKYKKGPRNRRITKISFYLSLFGKPKLKKKTCVLTRLHFPVNGIKDIERYISIYLKIDMAGRVIVQLFENICRDHLFPTLTIRQISLLFFFCLFVCFSFHVFPYYPNSLLTLVLL